MMNRSIKSLFAKQFKVAEDKVEVEFMMAVGPVNLFKISVDTEKGIRYFKHTSVVSEISLDDFNDVETWLYHQLERKEKEK